MKKISPFDSPRNKPVVASRASRLFHRLKSSLETEFERDLTQEELAEWIGEARSTVANWLSGGADPAPEAILRLIELLPAEERSRTLNQFPYVREFPTLKHPRLSHDPVAISRISTLLSQPRGTTVVLGEDDHLVTFVVTAMANFYRTRASGNKVMGLDAHLPEWFVPVSGITYAGNLVPKTLLTETANAVFRAIASSRPGMLLFNDILGKVPDVEGKVVTLSRETHVIIGVTNTAGGQTGNPAGLAAHVVTVRPRQGSGDKIYLAVEPPRQSG